MMSILDCRQPVIAKLNGAAAGLGATLALYCDIIMAADTARIGDPHVKVGLTAGDGGSGIWPYLIGFARAREFLYTGEMLTAERAADMGLINRCVRQRRNPRDPVDQTGRERPPETDRFGQPGLFAVARIEIQYHRRPSGGHQRPA